MSRRNAAALSIVAATAMAPAAFGGPFGRNSIVVMRVSNYGTGGSGAVVLEEFTRDGVPVGNAIAFAAGGADAMSMPDNTNHDRHIHRSPNGRYLAVAMYNSVPSTDPLSDPSGLGAAVAPRVAALVRFDGTTDLTTRLTTSYDATSLRGVLTTDGRSIWLAGDNASGATVTGGLRYTTRGSSSSVDLSQVQVQGGARTPDNIRDAAVFAGQLYDCSGSDSSVGKAVFKVGAGLPTSGSQTLVRLNTNNASTSSFYLLDLDPVVEGPDVLYTATSTAPIGVHKYAKDSGGVWAYRGAVVFNGIEHVIASAEPSGQVVVFAGGPQGVAKIIDPTPLTGSLSGSVTSFIITPREGESLGGIDFAPNVCLAADIDGNGAVEPADIAAFVNGWLASLTGGGLAGDFDGNGAVEPADIASYVNTWLAALTAGC